MHDPTDDQRLFPDERSSSRFRSESVIALAAAVPAAAPAAALTGSAVLGGLTAAFTIACVGAAALMI